MLQIVGGIAAGAAAVWLAPTLLSGIAQVLRPMTKTVIKAGLIVYDKAGEALRESRVAMARSVESLEHLAAEAKAEASSASAKGSAKIAKKKEA